MEKWKWLSRLASLSIVLGFFMPAVLFSCNAGLMRPEPYSLSEITSQAEAPILYLIPILSIVAIVFSLLKSDNTSYAVSFLWGQLAAIVVAMLVLVVTMVRLIDEVKASTYNMAVIEPTYGTYFIIVAVILFIVAWLNQKILLGTITPAQDIQAAYAADSPANVLPPPDFPQYSPHEEAREDRDIQPNLTAISGNLPFKNVQIGFDNFTIGRASTNHLHLQDPSVSRIHAVFRNSQGSWYLQDQESSGGTYVNGSRTDAVRLNDEDEIGIGPYRFRFHLPQR